jgi:hypothetical protein
MKAVRWADPDAVDAITKMSDTEPLTKGYAVDPDSVPKTMVWHSGNRSVPDFQKCHAASLLVSPRVRDIVEQFEPGVHQLLPVELWRPKALKEGGPSFATHYWLVICQRIDSVDPLNTTYERSGGIREDGSTWTGGWKLDGDSNKKVVHSKAAIAERHLWIDRFVGPNAKLSDAFGDALLAAGVTGAQCKHVEEI